MVCEVPLSKGKVALVDDADCEAVSEFKWTAKFDQKWDVWYAYRGTPDGPSKTIKLHQFLLGDTGGLQIDHRNGDGLDNRRCNLRLATPTENNANHRVRRDSRTQIKGVDEKRPGIFRAQIKKHGQAYDLGTYRDLRSAGLVYDAAAHLLFGEFARPNFPEIDPSALLIAESILAGGRPPRTGFRLRDRLSQSDIDWMVEQRALGRPYREIGERFGLSAASVHSFLRSYCAGRWIANPVRLGPIRPAKETA